MFEFLNKVFNKKYDVPNQINMFDYMELQNGGGSVQQIAINKPIRLIELFAG